MFAIKSSEKQDLEIFDRELGEILGSIERIYAENSFICEVIEID